MGIWSRRCTSALQGVQWRHAKHSLCLVHCISTKGLHRGTGNDVIFAVVMSFVIFGQCACSM